MIRGVRGATTVSENDARQIADRTRELIRLLVEANGMRAADIASAIFTVTDDLDAAFPAVAARDLPDWKDVPLSCAREIPVPGSLGHCIRILIHWNTDRPQEEVRHVYLRAARGLRPQWAMRVPGDEEERAVSLPPRKP
ncbi:MAG TPA: chorismate mutase [Thermoanaerobaculia bacterium]|nr:chorismate mutase [Thermoanaerobaculia bacterium]